MAEAGSEDVQPKRKPGSMAVLLDHGLVQEGDLLRYITVNLQDCVKIALAWAS